MLWETIWNTEQSDNYYQKIQSLYLDDFQKTWIVNNALKSIDELNRTIETSRSRKSSPRSSVFTITLLTLIHTIGAITGIVSITSNPILGVLLIGLSGSAIIWVYLSEVRHEQRERPDTSWETMQQFARMQALIRELFNYCERQGNYQKFTTHKEGFPYLFDRIVELRTAPIRAEVDIQHTDVEPDVSRLTDESNDVSIRSDEDSNSATANTSSET